MYATWDRLADNRGPTYLARTTDGGASWEPARAIFDPGADKQTLNNQIVVLPDGTLVDFFTLFDPGPKLAVIRSTDKGVSWSAPIVIAQAQALGVRGSRTRRRRARQRGDGIDQRWARRHAGRAWQDSRFSGGVRDGIAFSRSTDGGLTWSAPVRVNRDPERAGVLANGKRTRRRNDRRHLLRLPQQHERPHDLPTDLWLAQSTDGVTWRESHVTGPFDLSIAPNAGGLFLGDYHALASIGTTFVPFYVQDQRRQPANRTDVFAGRVSSAGTLVKSAPGTAFVEACLVDRGAAAPGSEPPTCSSACGRPRSVCSTRRLAGTAGRAAAR